jgi:hypothetical protein
MMQAARLKGVIRDAEPFDDNAAAGIGLRRAVGK